MTSKTLLKALTYDETMFYYKKIGLSSFFPQSIYFS